MAANTTRRISCPMHAGSDSPLSCGGELVEIDLGSFRSTTYKVAPCSSLIAQGWKGPQEVGRKTDAERYFPQTESVWQHRDGLVTFAGALA